MVLVFFVRNAITLFTIILIHFFLSFYWESFVASIGTSSFLIILGLIAAAYSSADSALTSLTTSFCIDFLNLNNFKTEKQKKIRMKTHVGMSILIILVVIIYKHILDRNVIDSLLTVASYTYGPLLGIFALGILTHYKINDKKVFFISITSVLIVSLPNILYYFEIISSKNFMDYEIGYELLPINGLITFIGLVLIGRK